MNEGRQILTIQSITRLEGHGKIDIYLDDQGDVEPYPSLSRGLWRMSANKALHLAQNRRPNQLCRAVL